MVHFRFATAKLRTISETAKFFTTFFHATKSGGTLKAARRHSETRYRRRLDPLKRKPAAASTEIRHTHHVPNNGGEAAKIARNINLLAPLRLHETANMLERHKEIVIERHGNAAQQLRVDASLTKYLVHVRSIAVDFLRQPGCRAALATQLVAD